MKRVVIMISLLMVLLMGCSSSKDEVWPREIKGKDFSVKKITELYKGTYYTSMCDYLFYSEEQIVQRASLIIKVKIIDDPVEYKIGFKYWNKEQSSTMRAFQGDVISVYYSDNSIKEGDIIKFVREEFWGDGDSRSSPAEMINLKKEKTYILFLMNLDDLDEEYELRKYTPCKLIVQYISADVCRDIIECEEGNMFYFDQNFASLISDAKRSSPNKGFILYEKTDPDFDKSVQALVDKYKSN